MPISMSVCLSELFKESLLCACASSKIQIFRHAIDVCYLRDTRSLRRRSELRFDAVICDLILQISNILEILCELKGFFTKAQQKVGCSSCLSIKAKNPSCCNLPEAYTYIHIRGVSLCEFCVCVCALFIVNHSCHH